MSLRNAIEAILVATLDETHLLISSQDPLIAEQTLLVTLDDDTSERIIWVLKLTVLVRAIAKQVIRAIERVWHQEFRLL